MSIRIDVALATIICLTVLPKTALGQCAGSNGFLARIQLINTTTPSLPQNISNDFRDAYCNAPAVFQRHLDGVDNVFLDGAGCSVDDLTQCDAVLTPSWGQRDEGGYTQIGISAHLWVNNQPAIKYDAYENAVLGRMLTFPTGTTATYQPNTTSAPLNTSWLTVLAIMAHEIGHVRWFEINARAGYGHPFDFKRMKDCNFFGKDRGANRWGWRDQRKGALAPKNRWRNFNERDTEIANDHIVSPKFGDFATTPAASLSLLLSTSQPWTTYLGANAPDEDFVETYKFSILSRANPPLNSMPIQITGQTGQDVYADFRNGNKANLQTKVACVRKFD